MGDENGLWLRTCSQLKTRNLLMLAWLQKTTKTPVELCRAASHSVRVGGLIGSMKMLA